jgi:hypothetical protein
MRSFLILFAAAASLLGQTEIEVTGRYWNPDVSGRMRVERGGIGTDIDMKNDLGFERTGFPQGAFALRHGRNRLTVRYTPLEYSGDRNVSRTVVFRGQPYLIGTRVQSGLEVKHLQLGWAYQFVNVHNGAFRIGPLIEADGFLMRGRLAAPALNLTEEEKLSAGLPAVGVAMDIRAHRCVDLYAEAAGMKAGDYGYYVGSEAGIKATVKHIQFTGGYRTFNLHVKDTPDFARLVSYGPFVGAGLRF